MPLVDTATTLAAAAVAVAPWTIAATLSRKARHTRRAVNGRRIRVRLHQPTPR